MQTQPELDNKLEKKPLPKESLPATSPAEETQLEDERLDEELEQTFPASDPLPWHHDLQPPAKDNDKDDK